MTDQHKPVGASPSDTPRSLIRCITLSIQRRILISKLRGLVRTADECVRLGMAQGDPSLQALYGQGHALCREYAEGNEVDETGLFFTLPSLTRLRDLANAPAGKGFGKLLCVVLVGFAAAIGLGLSSGLVVAAFHLIAGGK